MPATKSPRAGGADALSIIRRPHDLIRPLTLIDTPDLDGDQPAHHAQADRVFRWADAVLFLVTPEKYQMTELLPYYRLAQRYACRTFVMNKVEEQAVVDDYAKQIDGIRFGSGGFAIARDDSAFEPACGAAISMRRCACSAGFATFDAGCRSRIAARSWDIDTRVRDLLDRFATRSSRRFASERQAVDATLRSLRAMEPPTRISMSAR